MAGAIEASVQGFKFKAATFEADPNKSSYSDIVSMCDNCVELASKVNEIMLKYQKTLKLTEKLSELFEKYTDIPNHYIREVEKQRKDLDKNPNQLFRLRLSGCLQTLERLFKNQIDIMNRIIENYKIGKSVNLEGDLESHLKDAITRKMQLFNFDSSSAKEKESIDYLIRAESLRKKMFDKEMQDIEKSRSDELLYMISLIKFIAKEKKEPFESFFTQIDGDERFKKKYEIKLPIDFDELEKKFQKRKKELEEERKKRQIDFSNKAAEELMAEEKTFDKKTVNPSKGTSKRRKRTKKSDAKPKKPASKMTSFISASSMSSSSSSSAVVSLEKEINPPKVPQYKLHSRVLRWLQTDLEKIRQFEDYERGKRKVNKYKSLTDEKLLWQKVFHNLKGLEIIFSREELLDKYTYKYEHTALDGRKHIGRGLYGSVKFKGETKKILVKMAVDEDKKIIYHMHSTVIDSANPSANLFNREKYYDDEDEKLYKEDFWDIQSVKSLKIDKNDNLIMIVEQKEFPKAEFSFLPLE